MYADDLLLLWSSVEEAMGMWSLLERWNIANRMRLKLPKCSYVTLGEHEPLLEAIGLGFAQSHTHLGVRMTARGFDWPAQVERTTKKASGMIGLLRRFCYSWDTPIKIDLVKTFVLPTLQYALPLMAADASRAMDGSDVECCLQHAQKLLKGYLSSQWEALETTVRSAQKFVLGVKVYPALASAVTAIESPATRAVEMAIQMKYSHLQFVAEDNPYRTVDSPITRWFDRSHGIGRDFPLWTPPITRQAFKGRIRDALRAKKFERLQRYYPDNHPVPPSSRNPRTLIDKILTCGRSALEKHLIFWRGNQFGRGRNRLCVCNEPFTQAHTLTCAEGAAIPEFDIHEMIHEGRWAELETTLERWWTVCERYAR